MIRTSDRTGAAAAIAMALALVALVPITSDSGLFLDCVLLIAVIGAAGIVARRSLRNDSVAGLAQAALGVLTLAGLALNAGLTNPFALPAVLSDGVHWVAASSAPMGPNLGVRLITTSAIGVLAFLADQLAVTHRQAAWTLLPLGIPYLLTALALPALVPFGALLWPAVGYLLVLLADTAGRMPRSAASVRAGWGLLAGGLVCLLVATPSALLAGLVTPGLDPAKTAPFTGQGPVQMGDPSLDLRRNLQLPVDRQVLSYTTSSGDGTRLRLTSLPAFDATGFHLEPIDLFSGPLPAPPGVAFGRPRFQVDVSITDFNSQWLPLPYAPADFTASGSWRHDPLSLSVLATGDGRDAATNGLRYQATIVDVTPTARQVAAAGAGDPGDGGMTAAVPADLPVRIRTLAEEITRRATTDGESAQLIQDWLRSPAFSYSLDPAPGSGYEALTRFLFDDRRGYCEQFATSMAVLARAVGIPARVAVGFLPGERTGDAWNVSIRDMHAWPELYLEGLGWVAFEPTPSVAEPPDYATGTQTTRPTQSATPSASAPPSEEPEPSVEPEAPEPEAAPTEPTAGPDLGWLGWAGGALLVGAAAVTPTLLRRRRRTLRLTARTPRAAVTGAWDEIRDSVWDAGRQWPAGSPRQIAGALADGLPPDAGAALRRVSLQVERARYAEDLGELGELGIDVAAVRSGLAAGVSRPRKWGRELLPRSVWRRLRWRG